MSGFSLLVVVVAAAMLSSPGISHAWDRGSDDLEEIRQALERGDAQQLVRRCGERLDLTILGSSKLLSCSQAYYVFRSFFTAYPPVSVQFVETSRANGNWFASGGYRYESGRAPLAVYVRFRQGDEGWELREFRIDRVPVR